MLAESQDWMTGNVYVFRDLFGGLWEGDVDFYRLPFSFGDARPMTSANQDDNIQPSYGDIRETVDARGSFGDGFDWIENIMMRQ